MKGRKIATLNVYGERVPVFLYSPDHTNMNLAGYCVKVPLEIYLNDQLPKDQMLPVLYHELGHAYMFRIGLDQIISHEGQEMICETFMEMAKKHFLPKFKL